MTKKILIAYDGSELSRHAVEEAKTQAVKADHREIHLLSVINTTGPATNAKMAEDIGKELAERFEKEMEEIKVELEQEEDTSVVTQISYGKEEGNPGQKICAYAKEHDVDLVIVGSRGLGGVKKLLLGSVSNNVVQKCTKPVLVVK
ncbi:universal stress protein UspA [Salimicrobium jeotgali]|uniref:Universal stress protein UspA n=1 Tax=Salimicrobium jeotgali TaxID=1230341 RepID=K2GCI3_9BACI|nr:universal stress protein [Salimicrobium jeotgali]AKG03507.1 universal stress protein UspA [Salimicrobium jeotgali]EKE31992.1 UspA domain-containing protein [Salimicrobium jeotgali]MBM7695958.1 nucleotide-binding universal stress UspA family protein [Salimicrobium jeotgali]